MHGERHTALTLPLVGEGSGVGGYGKDDIHGITPPRSPLPIKGRRNSAGRSRYHRTHVAFFDADTHPRKRERPRTR